LEHSLCANTPISTPKVLEDRATAGPLGSSDVDTTSTRCTCSVRLRHYQSRMSAALLGGVGEDAAHVTSHIVRLLQRQDLKDPIARRWGWLARSPF
jgi:hypothetical protein